VGVDLPYSDCSRLIGKLKCLLQVFHLKEAGIACGYLSGTQEYAESRELLQGLGRDPPAVKILFVTPEKVARSDYLMRTLDGLHARNLLVMHCLSLLTSTGSAPYARLPPLSTPGSSVCSCHLALTGTGYSWLQGCMQDRIAVDEAHCVSQWGELPGSLLEFKMSSAVLLSWECCGRKLPCSPVIDLTR
jgi:hypothetical protein